MSGSCCGASAKSAAVGGDKRIGQPAIPVSTEKVVAESKNTGCCNDKPLKEQTPAAVVEHC